MNIVLAHAGDLSNPSGGTNRVSALAAGLASRGHDVTVVVPRPEGTLPERLSEVRIEPVDISTGGIGNQFVRGLKIAYRTKKIGKREGATVQFEHSTLAGLGSLVGCSDYVLDMHDLAFTSPHYRDKPLGSVLQRVVWEFEKRGVRNASDIVVVSERMAEMVSEEWGVPATQQTVIPNGYFAESIAQYDRQPGDEARVVFFGTLHPKVDIEAIKSIAELPEVDLVDVVGDGAQREALEKISSELAAGKLRIHGRLSDEKAFDILSRATVVINPQHQSRLQQASSPVKLFDYAGMGLPIVVSAGPDVARILDEHDAAIQVAPDEAYTEAVRNLVTDADQRRTLSQNATELAKSWTWDDRVEQLADFYDRRAT
jgi:glycosyltransferase involved in cell wall biosynthesis